MATTDGSSCPPKLDPTTADSLATIARGVTPSSEVLELGPGPGTLTRYLTESQGCRVDCVERSAEMAASTRPWARDLWEDDLDTADLAERTRGRSYDLVVAADVLEHLEDPGRVLQQCRGLLRAGGGLAVSLPNVGYAAVVLELLDGHFPYESFGLLDRTHRWFFTRESALSLLREAGFAVESIEPITRMPETTEFHRRLDSVSASLRSELLHHPDALTYQFIVRATPGSMGEDRWAALEPSVPPSELRYSAKLYWAPPGGTTSEERHVAQFGTLGETRQTLTFDLPDDTTIETLRLDPADSDRFVRLHSIEILAGDQRVLRLDDPAAIAAGTTLHGISALARDEETTFLVEGDDPFLQVPLERPLPAAPGRSVVVEMSWPESRDHEIARQRIHELSRHGDALQTRLQETAARHATEVESLRVEAESLRADRESLRVDVAELDGVLRQIFASKGWRLLEWLRRWKQPRPR